MGGGLMGQGGGGMAVAMGGFGDGYGHAPPGASMHMLYAPHMGLSRPPP